MEIGGVFNYRAFAVFTQIMDAVDYQVRVNWPISTTLSGLGKVLDLSSTHTLSNQKVTLAS